jgi:hypothetical protein
MQKFGEIQWFHLVATFKDQVYAFCETRTSAHDGESYGETK